MKASHLSTPRQEADCCWITSADPFDWTRQPRQIKTAVLWVAGLLCLAGLALVFVR